MPDTAMHSAGGKVSLALPMFVQGDAVFGGVNNEYRYRLSREWADGDRVLFVMMNPSTADPGHDDPTVAKCRRLAQKWGYGGLYVGNTFAYRCTDQGRLIHILDPVGPDNDRHLVEMAKDSSLVVFAYGRPNYVSLRRRGPYVARLLRTFATPHVLRLSKDGTPWHPLYLPETVTPVLWEVSA